MSARFVGQIIVKPGLPERKISGGQSWAILRQMSSNRIAADDNPMKLMSIAMKPLAAPLFPIERIEELTRLMGGDGSME